MYEHKILCFLEYEEDDDENDDEEDDEEKWKNGYFIQKMDILSKKLSKNCNLVQLKMMGKFLQTSPMKQWHCMFVQ